MGPPSLPFVVTAYWPTLSRSRNSRTAKRPVAGHKFRSCRLRSRSIRGPRQQQTVERRREPGNEVPRATSMTLRNFLQSSLAQLDCKVGPSNSWGGVAESAWRPPLPGLVLGFFVKFTWGTRISLQSEIHRWRETCTSGGLLVAGTASVWKFPTTGSPKRTTRLPPTIASSVSNLGY